MGQKHITELAAYSIKLQVAEKKWSVKLLCDFANVKIFHTFLVCLNFKMLLY